MAEEGSWQQAVDRVRTDLWKPNVAMLPDDVVDRALHSAILDLEAKRDWLWLEDSAYLLLMPSTADRVPDGSIKRIDSIAYLSGTTGYDILQQKAPALVRQQARGTSAGSPDWYAFTNGILFFDTVVAADDKFELDCIKGCPTSIPAAKGAPLVTLQLHQPAVVALAAAQVALTFLKNVDEAERQNTAYEKILKRLEEEEDAARADAMGGGTIEPDDYYYTAAHGGGYG